MASRWPITIVSLGVFLLSSASASDECLAQDYEVWAADQNLNLLYVLDAEGEVLRTINSEEMGGANRPHMLWGVPDDPFVYSANTVSASVSILNRETAELIHVVESVGKAPHAAQPNPRSPEKIYVFNIGPRGALDDGSPDRGETITEIVRSGEGAEMSWQLGRALDLSLDPALGDTLVFPSRRPVCGGFSQDGRHMLVTLFDGGLAAVDLDAWSVSKAWGNDLIARHGCGFGASPEGDELYVTAGDMHSSWLYVFDVSGSEPALLASHDLSARGQDAHGVYVDSNRDELWIVHRVSDNITIHPLATIRESGHTFDEIENIGETPDLISFSPEGDRAFVTLRGPNPAPTIPHATVGTTPGVSIIDVETRDVVRVVPLGDQEDGDFHGIFVPKAHHRAVSN